MNAPDQARINERMEAFRYITGEAEAAIQAAKKASSAYLAEIIRQREEEERACINSIVIFAYEKTVFKVN